MRATLGNGDSELFANGRPDLLSAVTGHDVPPGANHVRFDDVAGARAIQRLAIAGDDEIRVGMWPAEQITPARRFYGDKRGSAVVAAAGSAGWDVRANLHLGFRNAGPSLRLYLNPSVQPSVYARRWEDEDAERIRQVSNDELVSDTWPWLLARGYAEEADSPAFERFRAVLGRRPAHVRPGLRLVLTLSSALGGVDAIATEIRAAVDEVLSAAGEPLLRESTLAVPRGPGLPVEFKDDDAGFHAWLDTNLADGWFVTRRQAPGEWMLHTARCPNYDRSLKVRWTRVPKACSNDPAALERLVHDRGGTVVRCRNCT